MLVALYVIQHFDMDIFDLGRIIRWRGSPEIFSGSQPRLSRTRMPAMWSRNVADKKERFHNWIRCAVPVTDARSRCRRTAYSLGAICCCWKCWRWCTSGRQRPVSSRPRATLEFHRPPWYSGTSTSETYAHGSYCARRHLLEATARSCRSTSRWWSRPSITADVSCANNSDGCPETGTCTNHVEAYWCPMKCRFKTMPGTTNEMLPAYLDEHVSRERYGKTAKQALLSLQHHMAEHYPLS